MVRKLADRTEVAEGVHDEIRPVYRGEFADRGTSRLFAERAWHLFFENGENFTKYSMLRNMTA